MNRGWLMLVMAVQITACTHSPALVDRPAVLVNPETARVELLATIRSALGDVPVTLADTALTDDSLLLIERAPRRDTNGLLLNGRELERPGRFQLVMHGTRCVLLQEGTGKRWVLRQAQCKARP